jgi:integrase
MPRRKRRAAYLGCSVLSHHAKLRLQWRAAGRRHYWSTGEADTPEGREKVEKLRAVVAALVARGVDPLPHLHSGPGAPAAPAACGPRVRDFYEEWIVARAGDIRPALLNDRRRHFRCYILPDPIADLALAALRPMDVQLFQARLRQRLVTRGPRTGHPLAEHTVRDVIGGTFRAMIRDALVQDVCTRDPFVGLTFREIEIPPASPLTDDEWARVEAWFRTQTFQRHLRWRPHPAFHGYVFLQRWHGTRPSEASGLAWDDVDLRHGVAHIRRSYHGRAVGKPKTRAARRTIELHPEMIRILRTLRPLRPEPGAPVFPNLDGRRIDPRVFWDTWKRCLQACRIPHRGLYALKDSFVTHTLRRADEEPGRRDELIAFCIRQTGVREHTLREHYEAWWPRDREHVERTYALLDSALGKIDSRRSQLAG